MIPIAHKTKKTYYYNIEESNAASSFTRTLKRLICDKIKKGQKLVILCVGSDRATGDCLGPIVGYKLGRRHFPNMLVYGSLTHPVHAKNLQDTVSFLHRHHPNAFIIAVDASLGIAEHIGFITLGEGPLKPGIGVDKTLPAVGNIFITGIVNSSGLGGHSRLQTTRLDTVMRLADFICDGIAGAVS